MMWMACESLRMGEMVRMDYLDRHIIALKHCGGGGRRST